MSSESAVICPYCQAKNPQDSRFCRQCGFPLSELKPSREMSSPAEKKEPPKPKRSAGLNRTFAQEAYLRGGMKFLES